MLNCLYYLLLTGWFLSMFMIVFPTFRSVCTNVCYYITAPDKNDSILSRLIRLLVTPQTKWTLLVWPVRPIKTPLGFLVWAIKESTLSFNKITQTCGWGYNSIESFMIDRFTVTNRYRHHFAKKYLYTINHKRIALNYLYFTFVSGLAGALLATFIRLELSQPGSHFFKGDSVRYIQVITSHGLVMIFYVVIPIVFGTFANFFIPYHVGSKDVAYPRLNSIGFWILPAGFLLFAKPAFLRRQTYKSWDPYDGYFSTKYDAVAQVEKVLNQLEVIKQVELESAYSYVSTNSPSRFSASWNNNVNETTQFLSNYIKNCGVVIQAVNKGLKTFINSRPVTPTESDTLSTLLLLNLQQSVASQGVKNPYTITTSDRCEGFFTLPVGYDVTKLTAELASFTWANRGVEVVEFNPTLTIDWTKGAWVISYFKELITFNALKVAHKALVAENKKVFKLATYFTETATINLLPVGKSIKQNPDVIPRTHVLSTAETIIDGGSALTRNNSRKGGTFANLKNWSDLLLLWEFSASWANNPWHALKNASPSKNILIKNHKCNSPAYVMSGWTFITPFSSQTRFTGIGAQDVATLTVIFAGVSSTLSFTNLLLTRRVLSASGLRNRKNTLPFLTIALLLVMRMLAAITPVLGGAMIMLMFDRHLMTSFFDYAYGGDVILFHHLFWFFGHPEVYVVIIPVFGIVNMLLPYYNTRRITSKNHLVWATYVMAYMGFLVWGHHMYLVGLDHRSRSLYSTITVMISLPAVVKIVNWTLTLLNGTLCVDVPFMFIVSFLGFFLSGGLTGLWLSHVGLNLFVHDTFYVVAHFHFMFSCATFSGIFAAVYFYFNVFFNTHYGRFIATLHYILWTAGQWLTFIPLYWVGYNGLPRRYHDYPKMYAGWHGLASVGHLITMLGIVCFFYAVGEARINRLGQGVLFFSHPRLFKSLVYFTAKKEWLGRRQTNPLL